VHADSVTDRSASESGDRFPPSDTPLIDLAIALSRRRSFLSGMAVAGATLSAAFAFYITPLYTASALIMPPPKPQSLSAAFLGQLGAMAGSLTPALGLKDPADLYIGILKSRTIGDDLVRQFKLQSVYSQNMTADARKTLAKRTQFASGKDSLIIISVEDADPKLAASLANAYISELYQQDSRLAVTESAQRRLFFERELQGEEKALASAESSLQQVQQKTGVVHVTSQAEATIRTIAQLRAEVGLREVALERLKIAATPQNPEVIGEEAEIASMREQLAKLESSGGANTPGDPLIPFGKAPESGLQVVRAVRDLKYHESVFEALAKQYEVARIDEAKESQVIQVVDVAVPPEKKSWPPRLLLIISGTLSFTILGCMLVFGEHSFGGQLRALRAGLSSPGSREPRSSEVGV